jgi:8-oxo-dGTP diphosphatase
MKPARQVIRIVAAVVSNDNGQTLLVRKRGTQAFMQPGGKRDPGEGDLDALAREIREELGCDVDLLDARHIGDCRALAANEVGAIVEASLYAVRLRGEPVAQAEIAELRWLNPGDPNPPPLAPLTQFHVLPRLCRPSPKPAPRALFICKGNWFRSQMAAAIYDDLVGSGAADSAGTYAGAPDEPEGQVLADLFPTPEFFEAMERRGLYVRANTTRRLTPAMLENYPVVVSMAEDPFVPDFLRGDPRVIWWEMENPKVVDAAKAEEVYALMHGLVRGLISRIGQDGPGADRRN